MRRYISLIILLFVSSCAVGPSNRINQTEINISGGNYKRKSWDDTLYFKRTSWYIGAIMAYDLWIAKVDKNSPFRYWLESNKEDYASCSEFYIGLIYSDNGSILLDLESPASIRKQISELGFEIVSTPQFRMYLAAHTVFQQWQLKRHKISGFCYKKMAGAPKEIPISLPGFKTINILGD